MPDPALPPSLAAEFADLRRRLSSLEGSPRTPFTSINGGALTVIDDGGVTRVVLGKIADPNKYGVQVIDSSGAARLTIDQDGMHTPFLSSQFYDPLAFKTITSGSFVEVYRSRIELVTHAGLYVWINASGDASTTGEIRLRSTTTGATTSAVTVPAGGFVQAQFRWLHGAALQVGPLDVSIEARRTSGAGNVNVYLASGCTMADGGLCTATGL